jgi:hypothetical protein
MRLILISHNTLLRPTLQTVRPVINEISANCLDMLMIKIQMARRKLTEILSLISAEPVGLIAAYHSFPPAGPIEIQTRGDLRAPSSKVLATIPHIRMKSLVERRDLCRKNNVRKLKKGRTPRSDTFLLALSSCSSPQRVTRRPGRSRPDKS